MTAESVASTASETRLLREVLASSGTGTWVWDAATGRVEWDEVLEGLCGLTPGTFGATFETWLDTLHPEDQTDILALVQDALERRCAYEFEHRVVWPDGTVRWLECRGQVIVDEDGEAVGTVGCAIDITARKEADTARDALLARLQRMGGRLTRLERVSRELASAVTIDDVGRIVIDVLDVPGSAPVRGLWLVDDEAGDLVLVSQAGFPPSAAMTFARIALDDEVPAAVACRERATVSSTSLDDTLQRYPDLSDVDRSTEGFIAVPLLLEHGCLGVLAFGSDGPISANETTFLESVAGYLAQTVARVRLAEAVAARAEEAALAADVERRRRQQLEFLAQLTQTALRADDHHELMQAVTARAVPMLGDWCALHFIPADGAPVEVTVAHVDPDKVAWAKDLTDRYPFDPRGATAVPAVIRTGQTQFVPLVTAEVLEEVIARSGIEAGEVRAILEVLQLSSVITVPLITKRRIIGAMQFVSGESGRHYDLEDVDLAEGVAVRVAATLDNMWLTDQHRQISANLQQALLPPHIPALPGIDVAARYHPAGAVSEVGGDFYDLFATGDTTWSVVIGDTCGTGSNAAALTSIARHTIRAAARHDRDEIEVMDWLNEAILHSDRDLFCTACYGMLRKGDDGWTLRVAAAGHPLPIVSSPSLGTRSLGRPGTLLGVFDDISITADETRLERGDVVVFYTDGVTDLPPPAHLDASELAKFVDGISEDASADEVAEAILGSVRERVPDAKRRDDIALLVLKIR
jgi:PAS domain S-box-containing protein